MKKKKYLSPQMNVVKVTTQHLLSGSVSTEELTEQEFNWDDEEF